jgi:predicted secreted protein
MFGRVCLSLVASYFISVGCSIAKPVPQVKHEESPLAVTLSSTDNGRTITIKANQSVLIHLPVQRGTGYSWQQPKIESEAPFAIEQEKDISPASAEPGSTELQVFRLSFKRPGEAEVVFQYRRPWDQKSPSAKTFQLKIQTKN